MSKLTKNKEISERTYKETKKKYKYKNNEKGMIMNNVSYKTDSINGTHGVTYYCKICQFF